jgi:serine/threonine protein kinase
MISKTRQVKIMDFGLATVMQTAALDKTMMRGTPLYMAPEMITGRGVDYRSDIYSMGITLYEMATKHVPFSTGDVAYHHLHSEPPAPEQFNPEIPPKLCAVIKKAILKKQEERYQSFDQMVDDLRGCMN